MPDPHRSLGKLFGDLKVRPKLIVLHNLFFLVLTCAVYFTLVPLVEKRYHDGASAQATTTAGSQAAKDRGAEAVRQARLTLFVVLGTIYILAVLMLEVVIMPYYVYRPLKLVLDAEAASQRGDREAEIIPEPLILGDEIGQIMRARNATITELRRQEDDLTRKNELLETQDRLVSLGLLSASVAHELNTPLAVLQGSIEKLTETTAERPALDRLARMLRVTQRLRKISESLVDFSRVRNHHTERVAVRPLVEEAWSLVAIDEKAAVAHFVNQVQAGEAIVGNSDRLIQVFVNLLRNALHAIPASGHITVKSRRAGGKWVSISVEDDGPGIPRDVLPDIFEAFVTTRLDAQGTGLGLAVAEGIIRQHGGAISASNGSAGGACLEVTLPAAPAEK